MFVYLFLTNVFQLTFYLNHSVQISLLNIYIKWMSSDDGTCSSGKKRMTLSATAVGFVPVGGAWRSREFRGSWENWTNCRLLSVRIHSLWSTKCPAHNLCCLQGAAGVTGKKGESGEEGKMVTSCFTPIIWNIFNPGQELALKPKYSPKVIVYEHFVDTLFFSAF